MKREGWVLLLLLVLVVISWGILFLSVSVLSPVYTQSPRPLILLDSHTEQVPVIVHQFIVGQECGDIVCNKETRVAYIFDGDSGVFFEKAR